MAVARDFRRVFNALESTAGQVRYHDRLSEYVLLDGASLAA
jgi:hypothetical protein